MKKGPAKVPFWEKNRKDKQKKSLFRWIILAVFLIILVNLLIKIPSFLEALNTPFLRDRLDGEETKRLDLSFRTNILLLSTKDGVLEDSALVSIDKKGRQASSVSFNLASNAALREQFGSSFKEDGALGVKKLVSLSFYVIVDRYISVENWGTLEGKRILSMEKNLSSLLSIPKYLFERGKLEKTVRTNLETTDGWVLYWALRDTSFDDSQALDFPSNVSSRLPDKELLGLLENRFIDESILEEGVSVELVNASGVEGVGSVFASFVSNLGGRVVGVTSTQETTEQSYLSEKNNKEFFQVRVGSFLRLKTKPSREDSTGDVKIIIGKDLLNVLTF